MEVQKFSTKYDQRKFKNILKGLYIMIRLIYSRDESLNQHPQSINMIHYVSPLGERMLGPHLKDTAQQTAHGDTA